MSIPVTQLLLESARDAYLQVSVFVAAMVLVFSFLQYATSGRITVLLQHHRRLQPIMGALMGLTPGCGGAIVMMPLYLRGIVTFGTMIATLIATIGDSAFVLIATSPRSAIVIHLLTFTTAIVWGYVLDWLRVTGKTRIERRVPALAGLDTPIHEKSFGPQNYVDILPDRSIAMVHRASGSSARSIASPKAGNIGATHQHVLTRLSAVPKRGFGEQITHNAYLLWWLLTGAGFVLGVIYLVQGYTAYGYPLGWDAFNIIGIAGTMFSLIIWIAGRNFLADDTLQDTQEKLSSPREIFIHSGMETAFVTVWVLCAYLLYEFATQWGGINLALLSRQIGVGAVVAGAIIGLIPGCGPQIVLMTAYAQGFIPFSAIMANAISQDGDALFPLLARDRPAAFRATYHTTIPALLAGLTLFLLGY